VQLARNKANGKSRQTPQTKGSALFHAMRRAILLREFRQGEVLTEQQIGAEFNCSQGTVREALMRLQEEGLVQRRGYRGTTVSQFSLVEVAQMANIRIKLEVEGVRRSAGSFSMEDMAELEGYLANMEQAVVDAESYALSELDRKLHLAIFRRADLPALEPILTRCMLHMHLQTFGNPKPEGRSVSPTEAHRPILDALAVRDPDGAAEAIQSHINTTISLWSPHLKSEMEQFEPAK